MYLLLSLMSACGLKLQQFGHRWFDRLWTNIICFCPLFFSLRRRIKKRQRPLFWNYLLCTRRILVVKCNWWGTLWWNFITHKEKNSFIDEGKNWLGVELTHHTLLTEPKDVAYLCPLLLLVVIFCLLALLFPGDLNELELFISKAEEPV